MTQEHKHQNTPPECISPEDVCRPENATYRGGVFYGPLEDAVLRFPSAHEFPFKGFVFRGTSPRDRCVQHVYVTPNGEYTIYGPSGQSSENLAALRVVVTGYALQNPELIPRRE